MSNVLMRNESTGAVRAYEAIGFLLYNPTCEKSISGSVFPSLHHRLNTTLTLMFLAPICLNASVLNLPSDNQKNHFLLRGQKRNWSSLRHFLWYSFIENET